MKPWTRLLSFMTAAALFCMAMPVSAAELTPGDGALPKDVVIGDANGDGKVDTTDARLILQHAVGKIQLDTAILPQADADGNGEVDTTDARMVLQFAVNKISKFPKPVEREIDFEVLRYKICDSARSNFELLIAYSVEELAELQKQIYKMPKTPELDDAFFTDHAVIVVWFRQADTNPRTIINQLTLKRNCLTVHTTTGIPDSGGLADYANLLLLVVSREDAQWIRTYFREDTRKYFPLEDPTPFFDWFYSWLNSKGCEKEDPIIDRYPV